MMGPLVLFAAAMCLTPGPNVIMVMASAVNFGFRRAVPHILGISVGFGLMVVAIGLGLAGLFEAEPALHAAVKYLGAGYLLYLAWRIARSRPAAASDERAKPIGFAEAALFQWLNPKGWATAIGAFVTYTAVGGETWKQTVDRGGGPGGRLLPVCRPVGGIRCRPVPASRNGEGPYRLQLVDGGAPGPLPRAGLLLVGGFLRI